MDITSSEILPLLPYLFSIAYNILGKVEDAEDAVQESICKFLKKNDTMRDKNKLNIYLGRIVSNHCLDLLRQKNKLIFVDEIYAIDKSTENANKKLPNSQNVQQVLDKLSPKDRLVINLFYKEEFSIQEISEITEDTTGAVKVRLHRARKYLRKEIINE